VTARTTAKPSSAEEIELRALRSSCAGIRNMARRLIDRKIEPASRLAQALLMIGCELLADDIGTSAACAMLDQLSAELRDQAGDGVQRN
jgi:hypothetical protein